MRAFLFSEDDISVAGTRAIWVVAATLFKTIIYFEVLKHYLISNMKNVELTGIDCSI